jgi:hypothetical protein
MHFIPSEVLFLFLVFVSAWNQALFTMKMDYDDDDDSSSTGLS